jgi:hypothetical protein
MYLQINLTFVTIEAQIEPLTEDVQVGNQTELPFNKTGYKMTIT